LVSWAYHPTTPTIDSAGFERWDETDAGRQSSRLLPGAKFTDGAEYAKR
jgi:hypothetical protein